MAKRSKIPSRAVVVGSVAGVPVGQLLVQAAQELGAEIGPATGGLLASLISLVLAYCTRGGRKGEAG